MSRKIEDLIPELRPLAQQFLALCERQGMPTIITQTLRTVAEQNELFAQGRTKPGKVVTKARGGYSWHNFGRAFDVVPLKDGKADWDASAAVWEKLGETGESLGLEWGGRWSGFMDLPHFQLTGGVTLAQAREQAGIDV